LGTGEIYQQIQDGEKKTLKNVAKEKMVKKKSLENVVKKNPTKMLKNHHYHKSGDFHHVWVPQCWLTCCYV
jgi:hypothetical protein